MDLPEDLVVVHGIGSPDHVPVACQRDIGGYVPRDELAGITTIGSFVESREKVLSALNRLLVEFTLCKSHVDLQNLIGFAQARSDA